MRSWHCLLLAILTATPALAKEHGERGRPMTVQAAIADAESALDNGRLGDAFSEADKLTRSHGLTKDEQRRVEVIVARCALVRGKNEVAEKIFARHHKADPDDARVGEWYGRALEGVGKKDEALALLKELAGKNALAEGDSYWTLAQLEHGKGDDQAARTHAKLALEKPIVLQSDELEKMIHDFINQLEPKKK
jgi:predicted Zn-dependent protease